MTASTVRLLPHLLRPARGGAAAVVVTFALLLTLATRAGFAGLPLALLTISWLFKYAYVLFDHSAWGIDEPPVLDIAWLNPVDEQRPLALLVVLGALYAGLEAIRTTLGAAVALPLALATMLTVPACAAVLGVERNAFKAVWPPLILHLVRGLGWTYPVVLAVTGLYAVALRLTVAYVAVLPLVLLGAMFAVLSVFSLLGGAIYERRFELDIDTRVSPERTAAEQSRIRLRASEATVTDAYGLVRAGAHAEAWALLQRWLREQGSSAEAYAWLCERVAAWNDRRYATRLCEDRVERLLALRRTGEALEVVAQRVAVDADFRPKTAAATLTIARLAARAGGRRALARALLRDFAARYPGDAAVPAAASLERDLT